MGSVVFIDTSAVIAILAAEPDRLPFFRELELAHRRLTSPCVRLETAMTLASKLDISPSLAQKRFDLLLRDGGIEEIAIPPQVGPLAVDAFLRFGKGRHPARLNFADCLSYACARAFDARLLYKGDDFALTDIADFAPR